MADLPPLHNVRAKAFTGLPSHAASQWDAGGPVFSVDLLKLRILGLRGRCWQCGFPLTAPGYVVNTETDITGRYGELHTQGFPPLHLSCALYACAACPFLRYPTSRRRTTGNTRRGTAVIKGFNHYGIFFPIHPIIVFGHWSPTETIPVTNQTCVAALYEQALIADAGADLTATPRLSWTDSPDDMRRLTAEYSYVRKQLKAWAQTSTVTINGNTYRGRALRAG